MKNDMWWPLLGGALMLCCVVSQTAQAASDTNITAEVTGGGTCVVDAPPTLDLGSVDGTVLKGKNWERANLKALTVSLSQCVGTANADKTPTLTMTSDAVRAGTNNKVLYVNSGTSASGFGIVVYNKAVPATGETDAIASGTAAWTGNKGSALNGTQSVPLSAAVACGPTATCTDAALAAGTVKAHVVFSFAYK